MSDNSIPATPKVSATDEYHGIKVVDFYRWLENASDPAVHEWTENQNRRTRATLDQISFLPSVQARLKQLVAASSADYFALCYRGGKLFALKFQPPKEQPFLITLKSAQEPDSERVVVDPNQLNPKGTTAIDFYSPSLDGTLVAVSLSEGGSEDGTLHVYEVDKGKELSDHISRVNFPTAPGSLAWNKDGTGFYYARLPRSDERPREDLNFYQQVYFHKLGTPAEEDVYSIGREFPRIAEIELETSKDGGHVLATVANGDGGEYCHYLLDEKGPWRQITNFADMVTAATFGPDNHLYLLSRKNAPRGKILRLPLASSDISSAESVVDESTAVIEDFELAPSGFRVKFLPTAMGLYVVDVIGGPSQIRFFDLKGQQVAVPLHQTSSVWQVLAIPSEEIIFQSQTFVDPPAWYLYERSSGTVTRTALFRTTPADFSDTEVLREFARSRDGTRVPLNIILRKGTKLDGRNPTLLTGYGGFGITLKPTFSVGIRVWLEQGGIYAVANLRGGGEYGDEWHRAGKLTNKQNVFDDFIACAKHLIDRKYTSPDKLAIEGGSNGGLLMGAALTQHPELFRVVVAHVGLYDMLRFELNPNGVFNVTEYGSVKDPEQFRALYAYSPYHHVQEGTAYPATFLLAGENDGRVDPANSRKMAARLQAATSSKFPVLLRMSSGSGHGVDTALSEIIAQRADVYAFLFQNLGVDYKPVA